jgi:hypothetical protein
MASVDIFRQPDVRLDLSISHVTTIALGYVHSFCRDDYPCVAGSGSMASCKDPDPAAAAAAPGRVFARLWVRGVEHSFLAPVAPVVNAPPGAVGAVGLRVDPYVWIIEGGCIRSGDGTLVWDAYDLSAAVPGAGPVTVPGIAGQPSQSLQRPVWLWNGSTGAPTQQCFRVVEDRVVVDDLALFVGLHRHMILDKKKEGQNTAAIVMVTKV